MFKCVKKATNKFGAILILLSLLVLDHVFCSRPSSALAHNHHHHHHSSENTDGDGTENGSSHRKSTSRIPWSIPVQSSNRAEGPCRHIKCGSGRECRVNDFSGVAECSCMVECKNGRKSNNKPVCGTDGRLYPSYCDLRRAACLTGAHIFFSHYLYEKHPHTHHHHHHFLENHKEQLLDDEDRYILQTDFSFGGNETTNYSNHKRGNIISTHGANHEQDPECFSVLPPHQVDHQFQKQHHHKPGRNPLFHNNSPFLHSQSLTTTTRRLVKKQSDLDSDEKEIPYSTSDNETGENNDKDMDYDIEVNHERGKVNMNSRDDNGYLTKRNKKILQNGHRSYLKASKFQDSVVDYPSPITEGQKEGKFSSGSRNGLVDSRHILEHGHSDIFIKLPPLQSSYYNFMEQATDKNGIHHKSKMKTEGKTKEEIKNEEHSLRKFEMSDQAFSSEEQDEDDGYEDPKSEETLDPSAANTNLAWKLLQQEKGEIKKSHDEDAHNNTNGHRDDLDKRVSFLEEPSSMPRSLSHRTKSRSKSRKAKRGGFSALPTLSQKSETGGNKVATTSRHNVCSPQDYEILKAELFQYDIGKLMNHIKLMTSVSNELVVDDGTDVASPARNTREVRRDNDTPWSDIMLMAPTSSPSSPPLSSSSESPPWLNSIEGDGPEADKDNLLRHIFALLDENHDGILSYTEFYQAETKNILDLKSTEETGCRYSHMLVFDDSNNDSMIHVKEWFSSFSHFYDITMISLDKALETKETKVMEGDSVLLQCDITGSPPPYIQWKRYDTEVSQMLNLGIKTNIDGTLSLTNVGLNHAGHYSCQCPRNPEVVQTVVLTVETQPYIHITPKSSWKRPGDDILLICRLVLPILDAPSSERGTSAHPSINWTWLFNGIPLKELPKSDNNNHNNNKYIFENSTTGAEISPLRVHDIYFQDMGSYTCQAEVENSAGIGTATASLVVIDPNSKPEVQALHNTNARQLLVFHRNGLASYSAEHCGWLWEIFGDDVLQYSKKKDGARAVCDQFRSLCDWGNAVQVSPNYVFVAQPSLDRVLLIDVGIVQSVGNAVATIESCANPTKLEYVPYTDQLWIRCEDVQKNRGRSLFNVVENVSKGDHHHLKAIQFPLELRDAPPFASVGPERITEIYLPAHQDGKWGRKECQLAYVVSLSDEQSLRRIDLKTFTYHRNSHLNLTNFSCIPHQIHYSLSCTMSIINCLNAQRAHSGQLIVDVLTNSVRYKTEEISGSSIISADSRVLVTEKHVGNNTHVFVQRIGAYEINLVSHFFLSNNLTNVRIVHSALTGAYASIARLSTGKEVVLSLQTGEMQSVDELQTMVPHRSSESSTLYPVDNAFPLKTDRSVIVMDAETLRPRCKFYEEIPELQNFLTVQA